MDNTYGLIGYPLSHSYSRKYFTDLFAREGLSDTHQYLNFEIEDAAEFTDIKERYPSLRGCNVTIPHKRAIMPHLDAIDAVAKEIGAVNTIRIEPDGSATGFNTDYEGFRSDLLAKLAAHRWTEHAYNEAHSEEQLRESLRRASALILGTGGAAAAVIAALRSLGVAPLVVSRSAGKGDMTYDELLPEHVRTHELLVNTTPLGMAPNVSTFPTLPYSVVSSRHFAYDLVYNPAETMFMRQCAEYGAGVANGEGMLEAQAQAAWRIWHREPEHLSK